MCQSIGNILVNNIDILIKVIQYSLASFVAKHRHKELSTFVSFAIESTFARTVSFLRQCRDITSLLSKLHRASTTCRVYKDVSNVSKMSHIMFSTFNVIFVELQACYKILKYWSILLYLI